jgi:hypothetical protein
MTFSRLIIVTNKVTAARYDIERALERRVEMANWRIIWVTDLWDIQRTYGLARDTPWYYNCPTENQSSEVWGRMASHFGESKTLDWVAANW